MRTTATLGVLLISVLLLLVGCSEEFTGPENGQGVYGFKIYRYGTEFQGIWMFSATEVFATAADGVILHFDGDDVVAMTTHTRTQLNDIWAADRNHVFVVGEQDGSSGPGTILFYDGSSWRVMVHTIEENINGVFGFSATDVYAVTSTGRVIHYDGSAWTQVYQRPGGYGLNDVWCSGTTNVVAVGENGGIVRWDGASWSDDSVIGDNFKSVWGAAYNDIFVCGGTQIWRYTGSWGLAYSSGGIDLEEIHGSGAGDVWAVGFDNVVIHWDGQVWVETSVGNENDFHAVWAYADNHVVALSDHGGVYEYDGSHWNEVNNSTQGGWQDMYGLSADEIYAVGGYTLLRWDGSDWFEESRNTGYNMAVWCSAGNEVWTCGWPGSGAPRYVYHYDGSAWTQPYSVDWVMPWDVWGSGADTVFAAWEDGTVCRYDGSSWSSAQVASSALYDIWGISATDVFAVGAQGAVYRYNGTTWNQMTSGVPGSIDLGALWGTSASDVVAVGEVGTVIRFDGTQWNTETSGTTNILTAVWGDAPDNYWAVGMSGTVIHYDGSGWTEIPTGLSSEDGVNCVWGSGGNNVWIGADNDYMMHYELLR
jgi:hypothetical protein